METKSKNGSLGLAANSSIKRVAVFLLIALALLTTLPASAHCDSYDGPVVKDALTALKTNDIALVLKWINAKQEPEISSLFRKTYNLKNGDREVYGIVEKHFLETLVRLHRETEGAPYTGLKPAGSTKPIIRMSDQALVSGSVEELVHQLNQHIERVVREKYQQVARLSQERDTAPQKGRDYVRAYVDYTHTLEALHDILEPGKTTGPVHAH